jgi:phospholipid-binding lipoprotein MlaA
MRLTGKSRVLQALLMVLLALGGCAANPRQDAAVDAPLEEKSRDPWEGFNRKVFAFNDTLDRYLLKPVARGYRWVTPKPLETGVNNFFDNVAEVPSLLNNALQWKWGKVGNNTGRLLLNTTVGVGGLFDVARHAGLEKLERESFGQTLSHWGVAEGPYVVLPFLGPSTVTDAVALPVEWYSTPIAYIEDDGWRWGLVALGIVHARANLLEAEELMSGDKYTFIREAYLQRREYLIQDGKVTDDFGGDMEEFDEDF